MDTTLQTIIGRVPRWVNARHIAITPLAGGITNLNYRVDVDGESFVVRVCGKDGEKLGVNRQHEYACSVIASEAGVAPEVIDFFPDLGSLVTRFVAGRKIPAGQIGTLENIGRVADSIRRYHGARPFPGAFSAFRTVEEYRRTAEELGAPMPRNVNELFMQASQMEAAIAHYRIVRQAPDVPCHNDLLNENFIDDGRRVRIIDWEYAGMGDPFFDLGNFAVHHRFSDEQDARLIESYLGDADDAAFAHLKLMKMVSDLREAMWGVVQINLSTLDFDYQAYADKHFSRFQEQWADARVGAWLSCLGDTRKAAGG
ncbi:MAG: phosphotransferase [Chloroflexi bacterium]|nr:phosphotransferase [Chloroflexota bacterium]